MNFRMFMVPTNHGDSLSDNMFVSTTRIHDTLPTKETVHFSKEQKN